MFKNIWNKVLRNWKAGITVALVSLPLNIALSIASGAGPVPGIITGVWAGLIASLFGSSNYNIVGTAGALSSILLAFTLNTTGSGQNWVFVLPFLAMITGVIILIIWLLRLDRFLVYIPSSVMHGFAAGVAIVIAFNQLRDALGLKGLPKMPHFLENTTITIEHLGSTNIVILTTFAIFFVLQILFKKYLKAIPAVMPIALIGMLVGIYNTHVSSLGLQTIADKYNNLVATLFLPSDFSTFVRDILMSPAALQKLVIAGVVVALVAVLETLITAKIGDKLAHDTSDPRKEMLGLGLANIASGAMGGLPATGVFIRTGLNIKSGASDKMSATIAAVFTAFLALALLPLFNYLPIVVIASMLMNTAIGLIETEHFKRFWREDKASFFVGISVALVTIVGDASIGILAGVSLALLILSDRLARPLYSKTFNQDARLVGYTDHNSALLGSDISDTIVYSIEGTMSYLNAEQHHKNLTKIAQEKMVKNVVIRLKGLSYIDIDGIDELDEAVEAIQAYGKKLVITSSGDQKIDTYLQSKKHIGELHKEGHFISGTTFALQNIGFSPQNVEQNKKLLHTLLISY
jgi:sulfate permease, SulP family